jgi:hypothetical protein
MDKVHSGLDKVNISNFAKHIHLSDGQILAIPQEYLDAVSSNHWSLVTK